MVLQKSLLTNADAGEARLRDLARRSLAPADLLSRLPKGVEGLGPEPNGWSSRFRDDWPHASARPPPRAVRIRDSPGRQRPARRSWPPRRGGRILGAAEGLRPCIDIKDSGAYHLVLTGLGASDAVAGQLVDAASRSADGG